MVAEVEAVPAGLGQPFLPAPERALEVGQPQRPHVPLRRPLVDLDVLELEHHVDLAARGIGEQPRVLQGHAGHLSHRQQLGVAAREHLAVHLLQELVDARPARVVARRVAVRSVGERGVLREQVDDVHAEAVDPAIQPPAHHRVDRLADLGVLPVEVRLLAREQVQVVLAGRVVELPGGAGEERAPVGRHVTPPVPVALRVVPAGARLHEPRVLVGRVVDHQVHDQLHAALVDRGEQRVEVLERAERRVDVLVVADVVARVVVRRGVDGRQPDHVDAEPLEVIEPARDAGQVPDPVTVGVGEAARIDLVDDGGRPPRDGVRVGGHRPERYVPWCSRA